MAKEPKSIRFDVPLATPYTGAQISSHVEWAATQLDIYDHIKQRCRWRPMNDEDHYFGKSLS